MSFDKISSFAITVVVMAAMAGKLDRLGGDDQGPVEIESLGMGKPAFLARK